MTDVRFQDLEALVGANHPTAADTINRLALVETDIDGHGKLRHLKEQAAHPSTVAGEGVVYTLASDGDLYYRPASDGDPIRLTRQGQPVAAWNTPPGYKWGFNFERTAADKLRFAPGGLGLGGYCHAWAGGEITLASLPASAYVAVYAAQPATPRPLQAADFQWSTDLPMPVAELGGWWQKVSYSAAGVAKDDLIYKNWREYTGGAATIVVEIDGASPDTFKVIEDGSTVATGVAITPDAFQTVGNDDFQVRFLSDSGHGVGDQYTFAFAAQPDKRCLTVVPTDASGELGQMRGVGNYVHLMNTIQIAEDWSTGQWAETWLDVDAPWGEMLVNIANRGHRADGNLTVRELGADSSQVDVGLSEVVGGGDGMWQTDPGTWWAVTELNQISYYANTVLLRASVRGYLLPDM